MKDRKDRIEWLDVVRGIALCGIAFANIQAIWLFAAPHGLSYDLMQLLVHQRFFSIFSLLFGIGFGLMWSKNYGRIPLLRRFLFLGVLGGIHQLLQPGEALLPYALTALFILLPTTYFLSRAWMLGLGIVLIIVAAPFGGTLLIPGLFLLGSGLAQYNVPVLLAENRSISVYALAILSPIAVLAGWVQWQNKSEAGFSTDSAIAGLIIAATWIFLAIFLMHTPIRSFLQTVFAPMGRLALTNYIGATLIMLATKNLFTLPFATKAWDIAFLFVAGMLVCQMVFSWVWERSLGQGPLERLWRMVTWWDFTPKRTGNPQPSVNVPEEKN